MNEPRELTTVVDPIAHAGQAFNGALLDLTHALQSANHERVVDIMELLDGLAGQVGALRAAAYRLYMESH